MLVSPIMMVPEALPLATLQRYFYKEAETMRLRDGPLVTPQPSTPNPKLEPWTQNLKPNTRNPEPEPETRNPKSEPEIVNCKP